MKEIRYEKYSVRRNEEMKYELIKYDKTLEPRALIGSLLNIYEDYQSSIGRKSSMNSNYLNKKNNPEKALSKSWYDKADDKQIQQLNKNLTSIFRTQNPVSNDELFWTSFKGYAVNLKNVKCKLNKKVNGLSAKPIIDIAIEINHFLDGEQCVTALQGLGYSYRGTNVLPERHYFSKGEPRTHQIHMYQTGNRYLFEQINFRDYLRSNELARSEYEQLELNLSSVNTNDKHKYAEGKTDFVKSILERI